MPQLLSDVNLFENAIKTPSLTVVHFSADWVEQCAQVNDVLDTLSKTSEYSQTSFCYCQAEDLAEISLKYNIEAVPTVLYFKNGNLVDRVNGANVLKITSVVKLRQNDAEKTATTNGGVTTKPSLQERLKGLINRHNVILFMKGDRKTPRCGFSRQTIEILNETGVEYDTFDILSDEEVRQGLKVYSEWPTYPQLYVKGELIGGLDIIKEIKAANELLTTLNG